MARLGGAVVFLLVLVVIAGIVYHARQKNAAQIDRRAQDQTTEQKAESGQEPSLAETRQADKSTPPKSFRGDDDGRVVTPESENQVAPSSPQGGDIFDKVAAIPKIPASQQPPSTREVRQPPKDLGIDTALPIFPRIDLREEPSDRSAVIRTITRHDLLALIHRESKDGWYDVIDIHSGHEGWVRQSDVRVNRTKHPVPAAKFSEEFVGTDAAPEITVANQTNSTLVLRIGDTPPKNIQPGEHQIPPVPEGTFYFYATVPNVIPAQGRENFRRGYRYKWSFWIERHRTRTP